MAPIKVSGLRRFSFSQATGPFAFGEAESIGVYDLDPPNLIGMSVF